MGENANVGCGLLKGRNLRAGTHTFGACGRSTGFSEGGMEDIAYPIINPNEKEMIIDEFVYINPGFWGLIVIFANPGTRIELTIEEMVWPESWNKEELHQKGFENTWRVTHFTNENVREGSDDES